MTDRPTNPTDRPGLRPAAPERASVNGHRPTHTDQTPGRLARLFTRNRPTDRKEPTMPTVTTLAAPTDPAPTDQPTKPASRFQQWRTRKAAEATSRTATDPTVIAARAAAHRQHTDRPTAHTSTDREIAPVPTFMKWLGVWLDRTFGAIPLIAPLVVSGAYTMEVFSGDVIKAHMAVAFAATCALEGGLWKLSRLYEKTLVAGDSTIALRIGIAFYIALISGLIYWNADHQAKAEGRVELGTDALPAFGVAVMCALGVYIWSRTARWMRRQELHAMGRVDTQAPKFAALAWILCPIETPKALRHAVKYRIPSPVAAVEDLRLFKVAGRPAIWPPVDPTDRAIDRPAAPKPTAAESTAVKPTVAPAPRPTVPAQPTPTPRPAAVPAPTVPTKPTGGTDRPAFTPAAIRNAATIRARYGTKTDLRLPTVRGDLNWSFDRADPALKAYLAGADQPTDQEPATDARPLAHAR